MIPHRAITLPVWWDKMKITSMNIFQQNDNQDYINIFIDVCIDIYMYNIKLANIT